MTYKSPLALRYSSKEMQEIFSQKRKYILWRKLWVSLAKAEKKQGLNISSKQIEEMEANINFIDFDEIEEIEKKLRHDVMAHIHSFANRCPLAKPIIHLGATSCFVTDNGDLIQYKEGLELILVKLIAILKSLSRFAKSHANLTCLGFTHLQPAQLTTVGKRASLWLQDLLWDAKDIKHLIKNLYFLGVKGATGTQSSFLTLLKDIKKIQQLDKDIAYDFGFTNVFPVASQTYTRKQDVKIMQALLGIASSCHKFATDIRLLSHMKEIEEPFKKNQVGSSAMPHKKNPILSERICGLSRFVISLTENLSYTHATQWLERSLDDSSNRRLAIPEAFLATDGCLTLLLYVINGLIVNKQMILKNVEKELPFLMNEPLLMACVKKGGDRQKIHEVMRQHSLREAEKIKSGSEKNSLFERLAKDPNIPLSLEEIQDLTKKTCLSGLSKEQTLSFIQTEVLPFIQETNIEKNFSLDVSI